MRTIGLLREAAARVAAGSSRRVARRFVLFLFAAGAASIAVASRAHWATDGTPVCAAPSHQVSAAAAPDRAGGVILVCSDRRNGSASDIYAQRVDPDGHPLWTTDGVPVCTQAADRSFPPILADGSGGAIIAWIDARDFSTTSFDLYVQKLDASGAPQWTTDGVPLTTAAGGRHYPRLVGDAAGGAVAVWDDYRAGSSNGDVYPAAPSSRGWTFGAKRRSSSDSTPPELPFGRPTAFPSGRRWGRRSSRRRASSPTVRAARSWRGRASTRPT